MNKCLFLDRDGTINLFGSGYTYKVEDVVLIPGIEKLVAKFVKAGWKIIVITNQGGIGKGIYTKEDVLAVNDHIDRLLKKHGGKIDGLYYCPHNEKEGLGEYKVKCSCRKPDSLLLKQALNDFNGDKSKSLFIGDNYTDRLCAEKEGVAFYPFEFKHVITTPQGFRFVIDQYSNELIENIFNYANNL